MVHLDTLVAVFVDLTRSTHESQRRGTWKVAPENTERLAGILRAFQVADPSARRINPTGDGFFLLGRDPVALLVAALLEQGRWAALHLGLPARIALGQGIIVWEDSPWESDAHGEEITLTSRLLDVCPSAGVVLSEAIYDSVRERPEVRGRTWRVDGTFKGIGARPYWLVGTSGETVMSLLRTITKTKAARNTVIGLCCAIIAMTTGFAWAVSQGAVRDVSARVYILERDNAARDARIGAIEKRIGALEHLNQGMDGKLDQLLRRKP